MSCSLRRLRGGRTIVGEGMVGWWERGWIVRDGTVRESERDLKKITIATIIVTFRNVGLK